MPGSVNPRLAAAEVLAAIIRGKGSLSSVLPGYQDRVSPRERGLLQELCFGTCRHYPALATIMDHLLDKPIRVKEAEVTALLLTGLYQIREMRIPDHAVVNETVTVIRELKKSWAKGLANGLLRRYLRERESIDAACNTESPYRTLHPRWIEDLLRNAWPESYLDIIAANNQRPPMTLRTNARRTSRKNYMDLLRNAGIPASEAPFSAHGIYLEQPADVTLLPGFGEGLVSVQDEAAQLCAELLDLKPGQRMLDACAAPGGKTCHILENCDSLAEVLALDADKNRLTRVEENLSRLRLSATLLAADASDLVAWWDGRPFDRILLDAPCSASGVIRRHPDIKLLRKAEDIDKLTRLQSALLSSLWQALTRGGKLLYATCSVFPQENDEIIHEFAAERNDCTVTKLNAEWGIQTPRGRQLFPRDKGHDGFYYSLLEKR